MIISPLRNVKRNYYKPNENKYLMRTLAKWLVKIDFVDIVYATIDEDEDGAKERIEKWSKSLPKVNKNPDIQNFITKIALLERKKIIIVKDQELHFENGTTHQPKSILTDKKILDLKSFDLENDGHWKLLYYKKHFTEVRDFLTEYFTIPIRLKGELEKRKSKEMISRINWEHISNTDRTSNFVGKVLRSFRRYSGFQEYLIFLRNDQDYLFKKIQMIGEASIKQIVSRDG